jgi:hypothetical protein
MPEPLSDVIPVQSWICGPRIQPQPRQSGAVCLPRRPVQHLGTFWTGVAASVTANVLAAEPSAIARCISAWPAVAFLLVVEVITRGGRTHHPKATTDAAPPPHDLPTTPAQPIPADPSQTDTGAPPATRATPSKKKAPKPARRPIGETRELAANLRAKFPTITQAELARHLGISATRLRQIDRAAASAEPAAKPAGPVSDTDVCELTEASA